MFRDVLLNALKRLNNKSIDTQLCITFDFGSVFYAEFEDTKVTSVMHFFLINFFVIYYFLLNIISFILFTTLLFFPSLKLKDSVNG